MSPAVVVLQTSQKMRARMAKDLDESNLVRNQDYVLTGADEVALRSTSEDTLQLLVIGTSESDRDFANRMKERNKRLVVVSFSLYSGSSSKSTRGNSQVKPHETSDFKNSLVSVMEDFTFQCRRLCRR